MKIEDFEKRDDKNWFSKEVFTFENDVVRFNYKWFVNLFEYQEGYESWYNSKYMIRLVVDDSSIHESHGKDDLFSEYVFSFFMKEKVFHKRKFSEEDLVKVLDSIDKIKIEPKIKKQGYSRIKAMINGGSFSAKG